MQHFQMELFLLCHWQLWHEFHRTPQDQISLRMKCTEPVLNFDCKFLDGGIMVLDDQGQHLVNGLIILAYWGSSRTFQNTKCCPLIANIFKLIVSLLNLCVVHGIIAKSLLNLANDFHLGIVKFLAKFDAILWFIILWKMKIWWMLSKLPL